MAKGRGKPKGLAIPAVSALKRAGTERVDFGELWIETLTPAIGSQQFRARLMKLHKENVDFSFEDILAGGTKCFEDDGTIKPDAAAKIYDVYIEDWGAYDENGDDQPLLDVDGDEVPCTSENFVDVICNTPGGDEVFAVLLLKLQRDAVAKMAKAEREKNSSETSPGPPSSAASRSTRSGRKRARSSKS